jgi:hypothetical protein
MTNTNKALFICLALLLPISNVESQYRTLTDKEAASWFETPGFAWNELGAYIGSPASPLAADAVRAIMGHFDKFYPGEDSLAEGFPYSKLRTYEAQQVAAGQAPIFITATYEGKSRPVYWGWSLTVVNGVPTAPSSEWQYAVNVGDPRFIHFWINQYIEPMLAAYQVWPSSGPSPYLWFQMDQCSFEYSLFGVLDDNGNYVAGVPWDAPFPANQAEYETGIETFFSQVKTLAPNINLAANIGSQADPSHFPTLFANVAGGLTENLYAWSPAPTAFTRNEWYTGIFQYFPWLGSEGRLAVTRADLPPGDTNALLDSFVTYSLIKGPNFFFAPGYTSDSENPVPSTWEGMRAQLGSPLSALTASAAATAGAGYRLFSRAFEGGTVYLNWTGSTQTIALNSGVSYYNPSGAAITSHQVELADSSATYVTTTPEALPAPTISPRSPFAYEGPISVTMTSSTSGASIHYTLNGTIPTTSSTLYTGPVTLSSSAVVTAKAFLNSESSYENTASYTITSTPTAQFLLPSDSGPSGSYYPVIALSAIPTGAVKVSYTVSNGTPASGTYTFIPGLTYGILPLTTTASGTMTVALTSVTGAAKGSNQTLQYTVTNPVAAANFSVAMSPASQTVAAGSSAAYTVTVTPANGFSGAVTFGVGSLPSGVTGSFSSTSVTGSGSTTLTVKTTAAATQGSSTVSVTGTSGSLSHASSGSLTVSASGPTAVSVSPSSGSGASQVFSFEFSDPKGYANLNLVWAGFASSAFASSACKVQYTPRAKALYLESNSGALLGPLTPGVAGTVSNSQCTLNGATSSVSGSGDILTVKVGLTFATAFAGVQQAYMYAIDLSGSETAGWQDRGTWTVP